MKILYVEDYIGAHEFMVMVLEKIISGSEITVATSGEEAQEKLLETQFDLVLSDNRMPGITGVELTRWAREEGINSIIVIHSADDIGSEALDAGANDFLHKSLGTVEIVERVSKML
jgi:CheY-like chemotaxis protein